MRVPLKWLSEFIEIDLNPEEIAEKLIMAGIEVEEIWIEGEFANEYKVVEVINIEKREGIRLPICTIWDGQSKYKVVSAAPNVEKGKFLWSPPGSRVKKGNDLIKIDKKKVRDVVSEGMLLSPAEAGFKNGEEDKLLELPENTEVGKNASEIFDLPDHIIDISITPQRGDLLSITGIAAEIGAILRKRAEVPPPVYSVDDAIRKFNSEIPEDEKIDIDVIIESQDGCFMYSASLFEGYIKQRISTPKIISRLYLCGSRPINPIVDITNYIIFELGQPTHAFDSEKITGKIFVRQAKMGEKILCLDGKERELDGNDLIIADEKGPIAIAGVIGGKETGIGPDTKKILLESAFFNPIYVRKTAKRHGIETESSYRFARNVNPANVLLAVVRIKDMLEKQDFKFKGKKLLVSAEKFRRKKISIPINFIREYTGADFKDSEIKDALYSLLFKVEKKENGEIECIPPIARWDIKSKEDIVEEVARILGYHRILRTFPSIPSMFYEEWKRTKNRLRTEKIKDLMVSLGFSEIKTYPFSSSGDIKISNPITSEFSHLSKTLIGNIYEVISGAIKKGWYNVRVFEINRIFQGKGVEKEVISFGIHGNSFPPLWTFPKRRGDIFDMKGIVDILLPSATFEPAKDDLLTYAFIIKKGDEVVGKIGAIFDKKLDSEVLLCEIETSKIEIERLDTAKIGMFYSELPMLQRDISFFIPENLSWQDIKHIFLKPAIADAFIIDIWEPRKEKNIEDRGTIMKKSIAVRIIIRQSGEKTMTSEEVNMILKQIISELQHIGVEVRAAHIT